MGNLWEMIQNVRPTMLPFLFSDMSCVDVFHEGLCVPHVLCVSLFESGEFGESGETGDCGEPGDSGECGVSGASGQNNRQIHKLGNE